MTFPWREQTILLTGGTGSFGRKFTEVILRDYAPRKLIIFSRDELKQHEMRLQVDHPSLRWFIGDVRDRDRLYRAISGVTLVVHAAARKQVPACEYNPFEAINTNVLGAKNVIDAAIDSGVERGAREAAQPHEREHVTPHFYEHPDRFRLLPVAGEGEYGELRWTVDTPADMEFVRALYHRLGAHGNFTWRDVLALLAREPELARINAEVRQKPLRETA